MLFIFFDIGSPLSFWLSVALVIVIIIFHAQIFHFLLYILSIPLMVYCIIRWAILKLLEAYGVVAEKPRKVVDVKGMSDLETGLVLSIVIGLTMVFLANKACS